MEIHTDRFWTFILGKYYTLFIPVTGIAIVLILGSGFFSWWVSYRKRQKNKKLESKTLKLKPESSE